MSSFPRLPLIKGSLEVKYELNEGHFVIVDEFIKWGEISEYLLIFWTIILELFLLIFESGRSSSYSIPFINYYWVKSMLVPLIENGAGYLVGFTWDFIQYPIIMRVLKRVC